MGWRLLFELWQLNSGQKVSEYPDLRPVGTAFAKNKACATP
jgi:hypothetical protein